MPQAKAVTLKMGEEVTMDATQVMQGVELTEKEGELVADVLLGHTPNAEGMPGALRFVKIPPGESVEMHHGEVVYANNVIRDERSIPTGFCALIGPARDNKRKHQ